MNASQVIGREIEPADMGKDFPIPMLGREFAKPAGAIVDAKLEGVTRAGFNKIVHKIALVFLFVTARGLLANECLIVVGHKFPARFQPFRLRHGQHVTFEAFKF